MTWQEVFASHFGCLYGGSKDEIEPAVQLKKSKKLFMQESDREKLKI